MTKRTDTDKNLTASPDTDNNLTASPDGEGHPSTSPEQTQELPEEIKRLQAEIKRLQEEVRRGQERTKYLEEQQKIEQEITALVSKYNKDLEIYSSNDTGKATNKAPLITVYNGLVEEILKYTPEDKVSQIRNTFNYLKPSSHRSLPESKEYLKKIKEQYTRLKRAIEIVEGEADNITVEDLKLLGIITDKDNDDIQNKKDQQQDTEIRTALHIPSIQELRIKVEKLRESRLKCGCLITDITSHKCVTQRIPIDIATKLYAEATKKSKEEINKIPRIEDLLHKIGLHRKIREFAEEIYANRKDLTVYDLAFSLEEKGVLITSLNQEYFRKLIKILGLPDIGNGYISMAENRVYEILKLKLDKIWSGAHIDTAMYNKEAEERISYLAEKADKILKEQALLTPEIKKINTYEDFKNFMRRIYGQERLPDTYEKFKFLMVILFKLQIMHTIQSVEANIDIEHARSLTHHLEAILNRHIIKKGGKTFLKYGENEVEITSLKIGQPKTVESMVIKMLKKDSDFTKDFAPEDIKDILRFTVVLSEKAKEDKKQAEKDTKTILAILMSIFGTDIPKDRLRNGLETGKSNSSSTGKYKAFHATFYSKIRCRSNGYKNGRVNIVKDPVECQIAIPMDEESMRRDHQQYKLKQKTEVKGLFGLDLPSFEQHFVTLMERVLFTEDQEIALTHARYSQKEQEAIMIFLILKNSIQGTNTELFKNQKIKEMLQRIIDRYKNPKYYALAWHIDEVESIREFNLKVEIQDLKRRLEEGQLTNADKTRIKNLIRTLQKELKKLEENKAKHDTKKIKTPKRPYTESALYKLAVESDDILKTMTY